MGTYVKQILKDTTTDVTVKFSGIIDASGPTTDGPNTTLIVSMLKGALDSNNALRSNTGGAPLNFYGVNVSEIYAAVSTSVANSAVSINWRGSASNSVMMFLPAGETTFDLTRGEGVLFSDASGTGANCGEIFISTSGVVLGAYTIIIKGRKNPAHFDRGYLTNPEYFKIP
jgi:hypothetical protein